MPNLASMVTKEAILQALDEALVTKPVLRPATKFHLVYKGEAFPPKEVVRMAARKMGIRGINAYRLAGGDSTNNHLRRHGFEIVQFADWKAGEVPQVPQAERRNEQRIARLTYNSNGWQYPSGFPGKSKSKGAYEKTNGFGHEEWLLDTTKLIDGYHYGFLEPVNKHLDKYAGNVYDIFLFTVNGKTNEKLWVGKLNNAEIIDGKTSEKIKRIYQQKGWYQEMKEDLESHEIDGRKLDEWNASSLFNVRFKKDDFIPYPKDTPVPWDDTSISSYHYVLLHVTKEPKVPEPENGEFVLGNHHPNSRFAGSSITKRYEQKLIEYPFIHHEISRGLEKLLKKEFDEVYAENKTGFGTCVDLVAVKGKKMNFYEIKTYNNVRTCIRQAIGQLLEYSYYPDRQLADELFIVTPHFIRDPRLIAYIKHLSEHIGLPVRYICFDREQKTISQTI